MINISTLKNRKFKGSATVVVIILFSITLLFALSTTYITVGQNKKSSNIAEWNKEYYELDSKAVHAQYVIEEAISKAEQKTIIYMYNKEYLKEDSTMLPKYAQVKVTGYYDTNTPKQQKLQTIANKLYFFYVNAYLEDSINVVPEMTLLNKQDGVLIYDIEINCTFKNENKKILELTELVNDFCYDVEVSGDGTVTYTKNRNKYTKTTEYFISQPLME